MFLEDNLSALAEVALSMVQRLAWSVDSRHLTVRDDGRTQLELGSVRECIDLGAHELDDLRARAGPRTCLLGVGLGEAVVALLEDPTRSVIVWERDPWLLRQLLSNVPLAEVLRSGRLRLALGIDLLELHRELAAEDASNTWTVLRHPRLEAAYRRELLLGPGSPRSERRALLCDGGLFVDDVAETLRREGFDVWTWEVGRLSSEELAYTAKKFQPELALTINHVEGLAEACRDLGLRLAVWEIDPAFGPPKPCRGSTRHVEIFTFRRANVRAFAGAGYVNVHHLLLGAPSRRQPRSLSPEERARYAAPLVFVGASLADRDEALHTQLADAAALVGTTPQAMVRRFVAEHRGDLDTWQGPRICDRCWPSLRRDAERAGLVDPLFVLGEFVAAERRRNHLVRLAPLGIEVWGDQGFQSLAAAGVRYRGPAGHFHTLDVLYNAGRIHVDIGRIYQRDIVTMRVFDVLSCGGFILAEHNDDLADAFALGVEVESWRTVDELVAKATYYLARPHAARAIAERGRRAVALRHRLEGRVQTILRTSLSYSAADKNAKRSDIFAPLRG